MNYNMDEIYNKIKDIVLECGDYLVNADYNDLDIENKEGNHNIVTKYDKLVQSKLKEELLSLIPDASFIGEEGDNDINKNNKYKFIVDPIDGTTNFSRDFKMSAISVALLENNELIIGICYNPYTSELYEAQKGKGAYLNKKRIYVSNKYLKDGIVFGGSSPYYSELRKKSLEIQNKFASVASDYRRFGSAVIEICSVASGKAEVYFELKLMPWDYAAASLILTEAGGKITTIDGENIQYNNPTSILASNGKEDYLKYIK